MDTKTRSSSCVSRLGCGAALLLAALACAGYLLNVLVVPHPEGVSLWPFWANLTVLCLAVPGGLIGIVMLLVARRKSIKDADQAAEEAYQSLLDAVGELNSPDATDIELPVIEDEESE